MSRLIPLALLLCAVLTARLHADEIVVGSKTNTESVLLGDVLAASARASGANARHWSGLGGTRVVWNALLAGEVDAYVDYTGTLSLTILADKEGATLHSIQQRLLERYGLVVGGLLGFENSYGIGLSRKAAIDTGATRISDLAAWPELNIGFSAPFMERADGWQGLRALYGLGQVPQVVDHALAYRGIESEQIDAMDVYTTDAEIALYGMKVLEDDKGYFPDYSAVVVYRRDVRERFPHVAQGWDALAGSIDTQQMRHMNGAVKVDGQKSSRVAADFVSAHTGVDLVTSEESRLDILLRALATHMGLVGISLGLALAVALPLGIAAFVWPKAGAVILGVVGILQTVPSLALFVFLIPVIGIGAEPAILALFLYSLLPVVRNTHTGLAAIPEDLRQSARAIGLGRAARLRYVELPMATPSIIAGIKIAAVINVGTATLGALIGAGGLGEPILSGIRLADNGLILLGAVPAALLALFVQGLLTCVEKWVTPRGLGL